MPRSNFLGGMFGLVAMGILAALVLGCKQRTLNDQGQQKAISKVENGRASFLWPVVRKRGNAVTDLDSCWYTASARLPVGAGEDYRFPVSEVRKLFETSTPIPSQGARYRPFSEYQQAAAKPGDAASAKGLGTFAVCSATALGPLVNVFTKSMSKQSIRPGKPGLIVLGIGALLCGGSFVRMVTSTPNNADSIYDANVADDFQKYLLIAFNEDYRIYLDEFQALDKAIQSVAASALSPEGRRYADPCPAPAEALGIVEASFK
jgi:hypothetical protein